ncbi:MAG TPA: cellulose binding domain-containing protein [Streptosporangiaceae bacterium]
MGRLHPHGRPLVPAASAGWTATFTFTFADGQQITQSWNTALTQNGAIVTAQNASYNGRLAAGAATTFGFTATWNTANTPPAVTCTLS